jgi:hypothetical protein
MVYTSLIFQPASAGFFLSSMVITLVLGLFDPERMIWKYRVNLELGLVAPDHKKIPNRSWGSRSQ